jgi:NAD(P)-dependent dehydrogenase (short-subunit alcohol dehydrogenase family)
MLKGKTAVVIGGSRGIGRSIAAKLVEQGADAAIMCSSESEPSLSAL